MDWIQEFQKLGVVSPDGRVNSYVRRTYTDNHPLVVQFMEDTSHYGDMSFVARIFCVYRNLAPPTCGACGRPTGHKFNSTSGFPTFCSTACSNSSTSKKDKIRNTHNVKYGGHPMRTAATQQRRRETNKRRYGDEEPLRTEEIKAKGVQTSLAKYGASHYQSSAIGRARITSENMARYGYSYRFQSPEIQRQVREIVWTRYKVRSTSQLESTIATRYQNNPSLKWRYYPSEDLHTNGHNPDWLIEQHITNKRTLADIAQEVGLKTSKTLSKRIVGAGGRVELHRPKVSLGERELAEWIGGYTSVITSDRTIISPQELDVVLPEYKIAVEYCGLYWHSDAHKHPKYHAEKLAGCNAAGYRLITIYEDEWKTRTPHVQGKILSLINKDARPIVHPRACEIRLVPPAVKKEFFEHNHIQGDGPSSINIGLYHQGDLVACMGFISRSNRVYILNRYATSCRCPGGFSKLLHHFKQRYEWTKMESFADLRWSDGNLYHQTGFVEEYTIPPDYYWTDGNTRIHKFSMRHQFLKTKLEQYDPTLTEDQNCRNHGLYKIFDCGKIKFSMLSSG